MNVNPDGVATLCCQSHHRIPDSDGHELNLQTHTLQQVWNSAGIREIRRRMSAGELLPHCVACYNNERFGRVSYRQHSNDRWLGNHPRAGAIRQAIERSEDGATPQTPMYFDLRLGNICNLKCTACKPLYSSQIERDDVHSRWVTDAPYRRLTNRFGTEGDWSEADQLVEEIGTMADELSLIQLAGGEPTINKTQMALLKRLCATGQAHAIDLEVVTNLSNVRNEVYDIFAQFRTLTVALSIDGCNETYEYVRYPGRWSSLVRNVARLREAQPSVQISINAVLQAVNALNVVALFDWADDADIPIDLSIGRGLDQYNDFRILPASLRAEVRRRFDDFFLRHANRDVAAVRQNVQSVFEEMDATDISEVERRDRVVNFMQFVNDLDRSRRLSFRDTAREIYDGIVAYAGNWDERTRYA
jgi:sulfatase maturation enzyme AslB (radical SAM superfamily)